MINRKLGTFCSSICIAAALTSGLLLSGCASDKGTNSVVKVGGNFAHYLHFNLTVNSNARIDLDGNGIYAFLLNSQGEPIEVTDIDTFTDFISFDGINLDWYTRQANLPNAGFTFTQVGSLNTEGSISDDGRSLNIVLNLSDENCHLNQYIVSDQFTCQAITTDALDEAYLGRILDNVGSGLNYNTQQTLTVSKIQGVIDPVPSMYPNDDLNDWITRNDLPSDFPYSNFDIASFTVETYQQ